MENFQKAEDLRVKLDEPPPENKRLNTKDRFYRVPIKTALSQYDTDNDWAKLANPSYFTKLQERGELDLKLLIKARARALQEMEESPVKKLLKRIVRS